MTYQIIYSPESLDDLRVIYSYIAFEKLAPENAEGQVNRIRKAIRSLDLFPEGHTTVDWEPWASMEMRFLPVDNFIVYYLVDNNEGTVSIVRIFYGGQPVSNGYDGSLACNILNCPLNLAFCLHVHRSGRFIQHNNRRLAKNRSGNGHTLLLTTGE